MAPKTKTPRLGKGLSALMAQPAKLTPPDPTPPAEPLPASVSKSDEHAAKASPSTSSKPGKAMVDKARSTQSPTTSVVDLPSVDEAQDLTAEVGIVWLNPRVIRPNPHQPRRDFDPAALKRLAQSIQDAGLMQPIIVRPVPRGTTLANGVTHELIAGERRWRAVQLAELATIPAIVHDLDEHQSAQWALVENLQREDLNPIERAQAFSHLANQFGLSHEQIAQRVGVERPTISNSLRLLDLDPQVQDWLRQNRLSAGHARTLAGLSDRPQQRLLAEKTIAQEWSVRQLEQAVRQISQQEAAQAKDVPLKPQARAAHLADLEQQLGSQLETKVRIRPGRKKGSGTLSIDFYSVDQFDTLLKRLNVDTE